MIEPQVPRRTNVREVLLLLHGTRPEVDIEQRVDFVDDDVDIIGTDPGRNDAHPFAFIGPGDGRELPVGRFGLNPLKWDETWRTRPGSPTRMMVVANWPGRRCR